MSFVKDLDQPTLQLAKHLNSNHSRLMKRFRATVMVVVWVGGDEKKLLEWAKKHQINDIALAVIPSTDSTLEPWNINPKVQSTTVLTMPCLPKQTFINFNPMHHTELENAMVKHFDRYRTDK